MALDKTQAVDLQDEAFRANPYPTYARLRRTQPVAPVRMPFRFSAATAGW